jgi:hypothetical protein
VQQGKTFQIANFEGEGRKDDELGGEKMKMPEDKKALILPFL